MGNLLVQSLRTIHTQTPRIIRKTNECNTFTALDSDTVEHLRDLRVAVTERQGAHRQRGLPFQWVWTICVRRHHDLDDTRSSVSHHSPASISFAPPFLPQKNVYRLRVCVHVRLPYHAPPVFPVAPHSPFPRRVPRQFRKRRPYARVSCCVL